MDKKHNAEIVESGPIRFDLSYRDILHDQGVSIRVFGDTEAGDDKELLRFDCFDQTPHYHYAPSGKNERYDLDKTTAGNPLGWTMDNIRHKLPAMIRRSGYEELASAVEASPISSATMDDAESKGRDLSRSGRRTVHHMMPEMVDGDKIEVGNLKFGLEYRHLPQINDEGMAIHVLANVADQEVELLAFDCFQKGPHYHYGPRNQDIRVYWDVTTSGETLRWTLDQFKAGNIRSMIERAGYPGVAADLDQDMIDAVLPALTTKAREMLDLGESLTGHPGLPLDPTPNMVSN